MWLNVDAKRGGENTGAASEITCTINLRDGLATGVVRRHIESQDAGDMMLIPSLRIETNSVWAAEFLPIRAQQKTFALSAKHFRLNIVLDVNGS